MFEVKASSQWRWKLVGNFEVIQMSLRLRKLIKSCWNWRNYEVTATHEIGQIFWQNFDVYVASLRRQKLFKIYGKNLKSQWHQKLVQIFDESVADVRDWTKNWFRFRSRCDVENWTKRTVNIWRHSKVVVTSKIGRTFQANFDVI